VIFVALTHSEALTLRTVLEATQEGWKLGDAMIDHIAAQFPGDPPTMSAEDHAEMQRHRAVIADVLRQLTEQVRQ
jgi:hypothetical protein